MFTTVKRSNNTLLIPNAVVKVHGNKALLTIINTSSTVQNISIPELYIKPLPRESHIYSLDHNQSNNEISTRLSVLIQNLRLDHPNDEERREITIICAEFNDIFHLPTDLLSRTTAGTLDTHTTDKIPIHAKNYRYPQIHTAEVDKQIEKMLNQGIIKPTTSSWSSSWSSVDCPKETRRLERT